MRERSAVKLVQWTLSERSRRDECNLYFGSINKLTIRQAAGASDVRSGLILNVNL
jgi:hypothetical protein